MNTKTKHEELLEEKSNSNAIRLAVQNMQLLELLKFRLISFQQLTDGIRDNVQIYLKVERENRQETEKEAV